MNAFGQSTHSPVHPALTKLSTFLTEHFHTVTLLGWSMKCFEFAIPVTSTPFNLKIIFLSSEEGITKRDAAKDFLSLLNCALGLESFPLLLLTVQNLSIIIHRVAAITNTVYCSPTMT